MKATIENVRAAVVMDGEERCWRLKKHSSEFLEEMELLAEAHRTNLNLKIDFISQSAHGVDLDASVLYAINKRIGNMIAMIQRILYERAYPNVPRMAERYGKNEPALTEDEYKNILAKMGSFCREHKD